MLHQFSKVHRLMSNFVTGLPSGAEQVAHHPFVETGIESHDVQLDFDSFLSFQVLM